MARAPIHCGWMPRHGSVRARTAVLHQIPEVAAKILEDSDAAVIHRLGRSHEADTARAEGAIVAIEIVGGQKQEDAPAALLADRHLLPGRGGTGQQ